MENQCSIVIQNAIVRLLSAIVRPVELAVILKEETITYTNLRFRNKIMKFLSMQDEDFESKINFSSNFTDDSPNYKRNVKLLIDTIDSIRDDYVLDVFANLWRAHLSNLLEFEIFMRLMSIIENMHYDDLLFIKNKFDALKKGICEDSVNHDDVYVLERLQHQGLCEYSLSDIELIWGGVATSPSKIYRHTKFSIEIIRCGIDYSNYSIYKTE